MKGKAVGTDFSSTVEPILRRFVENIHNPYVWMPLGLFILCIVAYPITNLVLFPYLAIAFLLLAFGTDWFGRWRNRQTPPEPEPQSSSYRDDIFSYLATVQSKAVAMLEAGKEAAARDLTEKNLHAIDTALKSFPNDSDFHALMGYTLKDVYQSSKGLLSPQQRQAYLRRARRFFEQALRLNPENARPHNGMGNVLFFEGRLDDALKEHDVALQLTHNNYEAANHDKQLVLAVKGGQIPFDF